jgi:hypothetical protein
MTDRSALRTVVLFDIDSTLAHTQHRWGLNPNADPASSWEAYCAARLGDTPLAGTVAAARLHYPHHLVHLCSGSDASSEAVTRQWLDLHRVPFDDLRQRPLGDRTPNEDLKVNYVFELRARGLEVVLAYEDWETAARALELKAGVPVIGVNPFYAADLAKTQQQAAFDGMGGGL